MLFRLGDRVRIDIPDELDPDFRFHGSHGVVIGRYVDSVGILYHVGLEDYCVTMDVRRWNLRPPLDSAC